MVSIPDAAAHRRDFARLPASDRRAVLRAVNRGQPVEKRKLAGHAVVVARRQRRLWVRMPIAGPFVALTQIGLGWQAVVISAVVSTLAMAAISRFWWQRASRAEAANLAFTDEGRRRGKTKTTPTTPKRRTKRAEKKDGKRAPKGATKTSAKSGAKASAPRKRSHTPTRAEVRRRTGGR